MNRGERERKIIMATNLTGRGTDIKMMILKRMVVWPLLEHLCHLISALKNNQLVELQDKVNVVLAR